MSVVRDDVKGVRRSPRFNLSDTELCLNNINMRSRGKVPKNKRYVAEFERKDFSDDTFFGSESDKSVDFVDLVPGSQIIESISNHPNKGNTMSGTKTNQAMTPKNDTYLTNKIELTLASRPQSTPTASRCGINPNLSYSSAENSSLVLKKSSKSLFPSHEKVSKCRSCKKVIIPKNHVADTHNEKCQTVSTKFESKLSLGTDSSVCDTNYSRYFLPPCSSTKISGIGMCLKTPVANSPQLQVQPMSGIKELRTPVTSKQSHLTNNIKQNHNLPIEKNEENMDIDEDFPCTQPVSSIILRDVVAFVDVKIGSVRISDNVKSELLSLGAVIEEKFTRKVTHVIFRDGSLGTYKKAKRWKVPLVSIVWLNECKNSLALLPTIGFDPPGLENYESKLNRKSEKDLFELVTTKKKSKIGRKYKKMEKVALKWFKVNQGTKLDAPVATVNDLCKTPDALVTPPRNDSDEEFNLLRAFIDNLASDVQEVINCSESPTEDFHIPVPISLLRKCVSPRKAKTDIKEIHNRRRNKDSKISERRKNLEAILPVGNDADKENNCSGEHVSKRMSAPSEMLTTTYKQVNKNGENDKKRGEKTSKGKRMAVITNEKVDSNDPQLLSQTKKRQLLPLDRPVNELFSDDTANSSFTHVISNPYISPKPPAKCRKVLRKNLSSSKKEQKCDDDPMVNVTFRSRLKPIVENNNSNSLSRRSSSQLFLKKKTVNKDKFVPTIVYTGFGNKDNVSLVESIVKTLGRFEIENNVTSRTSHVIVDRENFRTMNLMKGIVRGCWIVHYEWLLHSLEARKWISEEKFEKTTFSPAVRLNRYDRQAFGPEYECDLFKECGVFYVSPNCKQPMKDLKELLTLCGGRVVDLPRAADIIVGGRPSLMYKSVHIDGRWVLDCITKYKVLDFNEYLLHALHFS